MRTFLEHFAFHDPWWLLGLLAVPPLLFLRKVSGSASGIDFPAFGILSSVGKTPRERPGSFTPLILCLALIAGILGLARPQWRNAYVTRTASGVDILIALDVSVSMKTEDFYEDNPEGTFRRKKQRISAAKEVIESFIEQRPDDRMGMIAFGAKPYSVCALTLDHASLIESLRDLEIGSLDSNGTAIGSAIAASTKRLTDREAKSKVVVLVTDGANNSGKLGPIQAAELAAPLGVRIYTIAIGTEDGRLTPGDVLHPRQEFDTPTLQEIARVTGGEFFEASTMKSLRDTFSSIDELEKTESTSQVFIDARELFPWCAFTAFFLSFAGLCAFVLNPPPAP